MSDFTKRRLAQMENLGATLIVTAWTAKDQGKFRVSTVVFGGERWTRVIREVDGHTEHFEGDVETYEAANRAASTFPAFAA